MYQISDLKTYIIYIFSFLCKQLVLMAMTLTTLWLDPKSNERLLLGCVNFFCHFLCIGNLHWIVPQSNATPKICKSIDEYKYSFDCQ